MKKLSASLILIVCFSSCGFLHKSLSGEDCYNITESELEMLSKNCDYVDELIKKGLETNESKDYSYDSRIVHIWKHTNCFYNYTFKEFKNALGEPSESLQSIDRQIHHYRLYKKSGLHSQCTIEVMNNAIMKYYCLDNVKITNM